MLPRIKGKLTGLSFWVAAPDVSVVDQTFTANHDSSIGEVEVAHRTPSESYLKDILGYCEE